MLSCVFAVWPVQGLAGLGRFTEGVDLQTYISSGSGRSELCATSFAVDVDELLLFFFFGDNSEEGCIIAAYDNISML